MSYDTSRFLYHKTYYGRNKFYDTVPRYNLRSQARYGHCHCKGCFRVKLSPVQMPLCEEKSFMGLKPGCRSRTLRRRRRPGRSGRRCRAGFVRSASVQPSIVHFRKFLEEASFRGLGVGSFGRRVLRVIYMKQPKLVQFLLSD